MAISSSDDHRTMKRVMLALTGAVIVFAAATAIGWAWFLHRNKCVMQEDKSTARSPEEIGKTIAFQKTEAGLDLWNTPQASIWTVHGDKDLPFLISEQERDIYEPPGHEVRRGDVVLDCGANIGVFVQKALSRGAGLVVAIEPSPKTLEALRRNFASEIQAKRVIVYPKGVWDHDCTLDLKLDQTNAGGDSLVLGEVSAPSVRVPLTTIDKLVVELGLPRVDFIKMDIEGAEKPALRGASATIKRFLPRMSISSEHLDDDATAIPSLVRSIEPSYTVRGCDCVKQNFWTARPLVLAFDAISR